MRPNSVKILTSHGEMAGQGIPRSITVEYAPGPEIMGSLAFPETMDVDVEFVHRGSYTVFRKAEYLHAVDMYLSVSRGHPVLTVGSSRAWIDPDFEEKASSDGSAVSLATLIQKVAEKMDAVIAYNIKKLESVNSRGPGRGNEYLNLGILLLKVGLLDESIRCLKEYIATYSSLRETDRCFHMAHRYIVLAQSLLSTRTPRQHRQHVAKYFCKKVCEMVEHLNAQPCGGVGHEEQILGTTLEIIGNLDLGKAGSASTIYTLPEKILVRKETKLVYLLEFSRVIGRVSGGTKCLYLNAVIEEASCDRCTHVPRMKELLREEMLCSMGRKHGLRSKLGPIDKDHLIPEPIARKLGLGFPEEDFTLRVASLAPEPCASHLSANPVASESEAPPDANPADSEREISIRFLTEIEIVPEGKENGGIFIVEAGTGPSDLLYTNGCFRLEMGYEHVKFEDLEVLGIEADGPPVAVSYLTERAPGQKETTVVLMKPVQAQTEGLGKYRTYKFFAHQSVRLKRIHFRSSRRVFSREVDLRVEKVSYPEDKRIYNYRYHIFSTPVVACKEVDTMEARLLRKFSSLGGLSFSRSGGKVLLRLPLRHEQSQLVANVAMHLRTIEAFAAVKRGGSLRITKAFKPVELAVGGRRIQVSDGAEVSLPEQKKGLKLKWRFTDRSKSGVIDLPGR